MNISKRKLGVIGAALALIIAPIIATSNQSDYQTPPGTKATGQPIQTFTMPAETQAPEQTTEKPVENPTEQTTQTTTEQTTQTTENVVETTTQTSEPVTPKRTITNLVEGDDINLDGRPSGHWCEYTYSDGTTMRTNPGDTNTCLPVGTEA